MKRYFATLEEKIDQLENEDSGLTSSDSEDSNGVKMAIYPKAVVVGYIKDVWFDKTAITNSFSLKNLIQQYRVTDDSLDQIFIVCRE